MSSAVVGTLRILLSASTAEFSAAMEKASMNIDAWGKQMGRLGSQMQTVGSGLTQALTLPLAAIGASATKAAIDFESSFAGVRKTVDATEAEFNQMSQALRELAKTIPVNVNELNRLAEAAGAMGIPKEAIVDFTEVMALLGVTTNLTSEQAAESIGKIQNIFGAAGQNTDRFASTLVALGNAGASTEQEIVKMAARIAGAGNTVGLTQAQVLSFASALASVGIEAEAGGSAISRVFLKMKDAVMDGGDKMEEFARVAGVSGQQFKQAFEQDAAQAMVMFVNGLGRLAGEGENTNATMEGLIGKNIILKDTLNRLTGSGELLTSQLAIGNKAWAENTALTEEARKRFETVEAKLGVLWGRLKDVGITFGNALLPAIEKAIQVLGALTPHLEKAAQWFGKLPEGVQLAALAFGVLLAAIGPIIVVVGTLITTIGAIIPVVATVGPALGTIAAAIGAVGLAVGPVIMIWKKWGDDMTSTTQGTFATVKGILVDAWNTEIVQAVVGLVDAFIDLHVAAFTRVSAEAGKFFAAIYDWLYVKFQPVLELIKPLIANWVASWTAAKDTIAFLVKTVYETIKEYLVDKFMGIVNSIKGAIESVTGFFRKMEQEVVGKSFVPDMLDGIAEQFGRLDDVMVKPTKTTTEVVQDMFKRVKSSVLDSIGGLFSGLQASATSMFGGGGGGLWGSIVEGGMSFVFGPGGIVMSLVSQGLSALGDLVMKGLKKIGGFFKDLFGGPSAEELAGREIVHNFEANLRQMLSDMGKLEPGMEDWEATVVAIRDAYIAQGRTEQEALKDAERLWNSSRDGADASRRVVEEITRKMETFAGAIEDAFNNFPDEITIPVHFDIDVPDLPDLSGRASFTAGTQFGGGSFEMGAALPASAGGSTGAAMASERLAQRLASMIDRLEHVLPIAIRDAIIQGA